ncbi:MAG: GAF domain-containing protein, partial [Desulfobacula sp.]|nr:GAF domain-containing protein [Desulfobacula sp.]
PLIMFLDDLQWVEPESIRILETIESHPIRGFYIVCAYRDNETHLYHPFIRTINKIRKNKLPVFEINLKALEKETQNHWISDLFCKSVLDTRPFSGLLFEKTDGNPFFIKLFLEYLSNTKLLYQPTKYTWQWNLKQINALPATGNVADFMINKIHQLDLESIELLKTASCLGSSYPIKTLEIVHDKNKATFRAALEPIINKGIIIRDRDDLKFVHDIVLESVYSMMPEPERARLHLKAGRQILSTTLENEIDEQIFNITDQMNSGSNIITESKERVELALLNLKAGQKKLDFSSLEAAEKYFQTGIALLPTDAWVSNYKLSLSLFSHRCEILYVIGKYSEAEQTFNQVLDHAELPDHLLRIFEAKSSYLMQSYKAQDVIDTGLTILSKLGYKISPEFNRFLLFKEILGFKKQLLGKKINDLVHLPKITDPRQAAIIRTFIIISRACALNGHPYAQIVLFKSMRFILTHGLTPYAAYIFSFYGTVLSNLLYDLKKGYAFGKLAMEIVEKFKAEKQRILSRHLFTVISINSLGNTKDHLDQLSSIVKKSLESGLFMNIFNLHVMYYFLSFISGSKLKDIEQKMLDSRTDILGSNQIVWIHNLDLLFQVVQALRGKDRKLFLLNDPTDIYDEKSIHQWEKTNTIATISDFYLYHQIISYFLHGGKESLEYAKKAEPYFKSYVSLCSQMTYKFFYSLALLEQYNDSDPVTKHAYLQKIRKNQKFFKMIYSKAPENNPHMYFLIEAEMAGSKNRFEKASRYYDKAILSAKESGYLHVEAVSCELAAKFFLKKKQACFARPLILESTRLYRKWGVLLKARELENHYAWLLKEDLPDMIKDNDNDEFKDMDIYSVLKASQAISKEIKPKKLMERLIQLIIENSGAQKAFLLLYSDNQMKIEAFAQTHPDSVEILQGILVEKADKMLAASIVYYTFLSKESVILNNASLDNRFAYDPYIIENKPVSILCTPIIGKKSVRGVLYLENNLMMGAFTKQRLSILDILITQVVISIENSRLYEKLRYEFKKQVLSTKKIKSHQSQLRKMSSQLAQTEERERKAIADDLHDSVTQTLAMSISILKSIDDPNNKENFLKMGESRNLLEQSLANIRSLTFQLSSPILYDVG